MVPGSLKNSSCPHMALEAILHRFSCEKECPPNHLGALEQGIKLKDDSGVLPRLAQVKMTQDAE